MPTDEEMLLCVARGITCSYGICDECPVTLGNEEKEDEE